MPRQIPTDQELRNPYEDSQPLSSLGQNKSSKQKFKDSIQSEIELERGLVNQALERNRKFQELIAKARKNLDSEPAGSKFIEPEDTMYQDFGKSGFVDAGEYIGMPQLMSDDKYKALIQQAVEKFVRGANDVLDKAPKGTFDRPEFDAPRQAKADTQKAPPAIPELIARPPQEDEDPEDSDIPVQDYEGLDDLQAYLQANSDKRILYPNRSYDATVVSPDAYPPDGYMKPTEASDRDATQRDVKQDIANVSDVFSGLGKDLTKALKGAAASRNIKKTSAQDYDATQGDKELSREEQLELARKNPDIFGGFLGQARSAKVKQAMDYEPTEAEIDAEMQKRFPRKLTPRERVFGIGDDVTTTDWLKQKTTADTASSKSLQDLLNAQRALKSFRYEQIKSFGGESAEQKALQKAAQRYGITSLADVPEDKRVTAYGNIFARAAREYSETGVNKEQYFQDVLAGKYSDRFTEGQKKAFEKDPERLARGFANKLAREEVASRKKQFKSTFKGTEYDPYVGADTIAKKYEYTEAGSNPPEVGPPTDIELGGRLAKGLRAAEKKYAEGRTREPSQEEQMFNYWNEPSNKRYQADMLRRRLAADASFAGQFQMQTGIAGIDAVKMSDRDLSELQLKSIGLGK